MTAISSMSVVSSRRVISRLRMLDRLRPVPVREGNRMASGWADKSNGTNKIRSPLPSSVGTSLPNLENYLPRLRLTGLVDKAPGQVARRRFLEYPHSERRGRVKVSITPSKLCDQCGRFGRSFGTSRADPSVKLRKSVHEAGCKGGRLHGLKLQGRACPRGRPTGWTLRSLFPFPA